MLRPGQYNQTLNVSSAAADALSFGFKASFVSVKNDGPKGCFVSFRSCTATTSDYLLSSGDTIQFTAIMCDQVSLVASSSGGSVRVLALG